MLRKLKQIKIATVSEQYSNPTKLPSPQHLSAFSCAISLPRTLSFSCPVFLTTEAMAEQQIAAVRFVLKAGCCLKYLLLIEGAIQLQLERHCNILIHALIHAFLWKLGLTYICFFFKG